MVWILRPEAERIESGRSGLIRVAVVFAAPQQRDRRQPRGRIRRCQQVPTGGQELGGRPGTGESELGVERERQGTPSVYIIRNGQIDAAPELIDRNLLDIASRSMLTLITSVAMGDLIRIWALAERDGVDFNYIGIPKEEKEAAMDAFNPDEMRRLFDLGHRMALEEQPWRKDPPTFFKQDSATLEVQ